MPEVGTAYVKVSGDFTQLTSQLAGVVAPSKMSKLGKAAGVGLAAGFAAAGIGKMLFDVGKEFDEAYDNIRTQTGATGKEMRKLKGAFRDTLGSIPTDFDTAAKAVAGLNQRLEITGKPLARLSKQLTALSEVTGTDITENVEAVTRLFGDWSVKTKDQTDTLDGLFRIAQQTGGSVSELSRLLVQFGAPLRNLGIDLDFAAAMFANFEKSGVNISTVLSGLRLSVGNLATPTDDLAKLLQSLGINAAKPEKALTDIFNNIKRLDDQASKALAIEVFGKRAGPDLRDAVVTGRFALQDLMKEFRSGDGTIRKTERATRDLEEQWKLFANRLKLFVEPIARDVFKGIGDLMKDVNRAFKKGGLGGVGNLIADRLQRAIPKIAEAGVAIGAKLGPALIRGFFDSSPIVQFLAGAWLGAKFAGKSETAGKTFGRKFGRGMIVGLLLVAPDIIVAAYKLGEKIGHAIDEAVPKLSELITSGMKEPIPIADIVKSGQFKLVEERFESMGLSAQQAHKKAVEAFRKLEQQGGQHVKNFGNNAKRTFDRTRDEVGQSTQGIARNTEDDLGKAEQSAKRHGKGAGKGISQPYQAAAGAARGALGNIERNTNKALKGFKQKPVKFGLEEMAESEAVGGAGRQRGGFAVPGSGSGDKVHMQAMVEPGEQVFVLNRNASGVLRRLQGLNQRIPRFQTGGGLQPGIAALVKWAGKTLGLNVSSGVRAGTGSFHNTGEAADFVPPSMGATKSIFANWKDQLEELFYDPWGGWDAGQQIGAIGDHMDHIHAAILGAGGGGPTAGARLRKIKRVLIGGPDLAQKNIAQGSSDRGVNAANAMLSKLAPVAPDVGGVGVLSKAQFLAVANAAIKMTRPESAGFSAAGLLTLAMAESGLDPGSQNLWDSNAAAGDPSGGLMQLTGTNFRAYHEPGTANSIFDALANVAASINYQADRYGGQVTHSPYQRGGLLKMQRGGIVQKLQGGGAVKGHGGESPSTPLFDWFRVMFDTPLVDQMKGIVGKIGVSPSRFENMASAYSGVGGALDMDELGTVAMALDTDDPITGETIYGIARGRTAVGGLGSDIGSGWLDLELGQLVLIRDRIRAAIPIVETLTKFVKGKIDALTKPGKNSYESIAKRLYDDAKKAYDDLQEKIGNLRAQIQKLEGIKKPTDEQKQRLTDLKGRLNGLVNALGVAKQIMTDSKFRVGAVGDVAGAFAARVTALDAVKVALKTDGAEDGSWPSLEELQGRTGEAGSIFDTKLEITEALRAAGEAAAGAALDTAGGGEPGALAALNADLLAQQLEEQRRLTAIAEAQTPVFAQYGRTFHTGGIVGGVGNQGVTVQAGEGIFTEEQMAAMGGQNVTVVVEDGAVDPNRIRVVVNDELSSVAARATRVGGTKGQKAVYR